MKHKNGVQVFIAISLILAMSQLYAKNGGGQMMGIPGYGAGPGMMEGKGQSKNMMGRSNMQGGPEMAFQRLNPAAVTIIENYRVKIESVFLDAQKARLSLDAKRRTLMTKLKDLGDQYQSNNAVGKDIVAVLKELNTITGQIQVINQDAMAKIQKLNVDREKELQTANDEWLKTLEKNDQELKRVLDLLEKRKGSR